MARYQRTQRKSNWREEPATPAQYGILATVASEHIVPLAVLDEMERQQAQGMTKAQASAWMEILKATAPLPLSPEEQHATEPGLYELDGMQYEAKFNRKTGRLNVFHASTGEYARGIAPKLKVMHKVAVEAAA